MFACVVFVCVCVSCCFPPLLLRTRNLRILTAYTFVYIYFQIKFLTDKATDKVLGVHIIAEAAGEMIAEPTMGLTFGASSEDIARTCHAHPTVMEAVKEAAMAAHDKPIHF